MGNNLNGGSLDGLLEECKEKMKAVDTTATDLMTSIDMMHATADLLVHHMNANFDNTDGNSEAVGQNLQDCKLIAKRLIITMERSVHRQKWSAVNTLKDFLHFVTRNIDKNIAPVASVELSLDAYSNNNCVEQSSSEDKHIKQLQDENSRLKNTVHSLQEYVELLAEKEKTFSAEKKTHIQNSKLLEETIESLQDSANNYITLKDKVDVQSYEIVNLRSELSFEINAKTVKNLENDKHIHRLQTLQDEYTDKYSTEVQIMKEDKATLENKNVMLISELNTARDTYTAYSEMKNTELVQKQADMNNMKLEFERIKEQDTKVLSALESENNAVLAKHVELEMMNNSISKDMDIAKGQNVSLQNSIDDKERTIQMKEKQFLEQQRHMEIEEKKHKENLENEKLLLINANQNLEESREKAILLKECIEIKNAAENKKSMVIKGLEEEQKLHENIIQERNKQLCKMEREITVNKQTIFELTKLNNKSEKELIEGRSTFKFQQEQLTMQKEKADSDIAKLEMESKSLREQHFNERNIIERENRKKDSTIHTMDTEIKQLMTNNMRQREQHEDISKAFVNVEKELAKMRRKKITQVQLYSQNRTELITSIEREITAYLKRKMNCDKMELEFVQCARASDIQSGIPLLLLCASVSRLGTDVTNTIHGLTLTPKTALLIFHHKDEHALPNQSSERILTGQELRVLGGIFDVAFYSGKGIYPCDMNKINIISLINFINREGERTIRDV